MAFVGKNKSKCKSVRGGKSRCQMAASLAKKVGVGAAVCAAAGHVAGTPDVSLVSGNALSVNDCLKKMSKSKPGPSDWSISCASTLQSLLTDGGSADENQPWRKGAAASKFYDAGRDLSETFGDEDGNGSRGIREGLQGLIGGKRSSTAASKKDKKRRGSSEEKVQKKNAEEQVSPASKDASSEASKATKGGKNLLKMRRVASELLKMRQSRRSAFSHDDEEDDGDYLPDHIRNLLKGKRGGREIRVVNLSADGSPSSRTISVGELGDLLGERGGSGGSAIRQLIDSHMADGDDGDDEDVGLLKDVEKLVEDSSDSNANANGFRKASSDSNGRKKLSRKDLQELEKKLPRVSRPPSMYEMNSATVGGSTAASYSMERLMRDIITKQEEKRRVQRQKGKNELKGKLRGSEGKEMSREKGSSQEGQVEGSSAQEAKQETGFPQELPPRAQDTLRSFLGPRPADDASVGEQEAPSTNSNSRTASVEEKLSSGEEEEEYYEVDVEDFDLAEFASIEEFDLSDASDSAEELNLEAEDFDGLAEFLRRLQHEGEV